MSHDRSQPKSPVRVAVVDKNPLVRAGLEHLVIKDTRFRLVLSCIDGDQFFAELEAARPDVTVCGWVIPPGNGKFILDNLRNLSDPPRVVVYTGAVEDSVAAAAMAHGAAALVSKSEDPGYLLDTVAEVARGRMVFPFVDVRVINRNPLASLTRRELDVLAALAAGKTNKEIAAAQGVSPNTVKFHVRNVFEKLGVRNRGQAIAAYLRS